MQEFIIVRTKDLQDGTPDLGRMLGPGYSFGVTGGAAWSTNGIDAITLKKLGTIGKKDIWAGSCSGNAKMYITEDLGQSSIVLNKGNSDKKLRALFKSNRLKRVVRRSDGADMGYLPPVMLAGDDDVAVLTGEVGRYKFELVED